MVHYNEKAWEDYKNKVYAIYVLGFLILAYYTLAKEMDTWNILMLF